MSEIELKRVYQSSAFSGHLLAKNLFDSACSGQYFMSEIKMVLLAVASIFITNMSGIRLPLKIRESTLQI